MRALVLRLITLSAVRLSAVRLSAVWLSVVIGASVAEAQLRELPSGFQRVSGRYVDVVTDMPLSDELRDLAQVFDAAVPIWCEQFAIELDDVDRWRVEAFVMLERERFQSAGFIPEQIPNFAFGFQFGNQIWVAEQPSAYYRRHLLLHEGTHWFMNRRFGDYGPPWLMEGMAEWLATHGWDGQQLTLGVIPKDRQQVPYWGRISLIQQQLNDGTAPSLETILRYGDTAHQRVDAYAWSWAAVLFLKNHPDTSRIFQRVFDQPMRSDHTLSRWLFVRLRDRWPRLRQDWNAFLSELEYGYDPSRGMLLSSRASPLLSERGVEATIQADRSWQSAGVSVAAPTTLRITATGSYTVGQQPAPWKCEPPGVTLEYYRGQPLGKLLLAVASPIEKEPSGSRLLRTVAVGAGGEFDLEHSGELFFKVNEANGGLEDNTGQLTIEIRP